MKHLSAVLLLLGLAAFPVHAATVLLGGDIVSVEHTLADPTDLWVSVDELTRVNGFELKPEGACLDAICVPVQQDRDSDIFVTRQGKPWFNVTELAARIQQPYVVDSEADVWSFGAVPAQRQSFIRDAVAPDFTLPDWQGNTSSLSDFKGKKVMLLTWASW
jgi:hypothetical protein